MRKFIHSNFEIDLSKLKISDIQENPWFSDKFFAKFSFPFNLDLSEENDINFGFISFYNANSHETIFKGKYVHRHIMEEAVLEIETVDTQISLTFSYGFDEFPNFKKKLSELPLDKFEVPNIYSHAATVISQTWPAVNYNFPQIHIDKIDNTQEPWEAFEGTINNYKNDAFLINNVGADDITYNRNIMQPLAHVLHIFKKGFEDAGKTAVGDIFEDDTFKKMLVYSDKEYWTTFEQESYTILKMSSDLTSFENIIIEGVFPGTFSWSTPIVNPTVQIWRYFSQVDITSPGKYRIIGSIKTFHTRFHSVQFKIKYRDSSLYIFQTTEGQFRRTTNIDIVFETLADLNPNFITVEVFCGPSINRTIIDLSINPIRLHDSSGTAIPTIVNLNQVDLTKAVPDITFGDFITIYKNWFNLDLSSIGNEIKINFVNNEKKASQPFDLTNYEVKFPLRKFNRGISFLLKFQETQNKEYTFPSVYQSIDQIQTSDFKTDDKTNEITINALPLPFLVKNNIQTSHAFETDGSKIYTVLYDGLTNGINITKDPLEMQLQQVHEKNYKDWMAFRIKSQGFQWSFISSYEDISELYYKGRVFAYGLNHVVKTINRTEVSEDIFEVEIETEAEI